MAIDFRTVSITIPQGTGRRSIDGAAVFNSTVLNAGVALNGFALDFTAPDRPFNVMEADVDIVAITQNTVTFRVECQLADRNFDDPYSGYVTAMVTADVG
ncbi:MAG: hypothetical protein QNJ42_20365 [Crocosphaera sp.]|nr:hypothetical protein [Crocosphaera sp.]